MLTSTETGVNECKALCELQVEGPVQKKMWLFLLFTSCLLNLTFVCGVFPAGLAQCYSWGREWCAEVI